MRDVGNATLELDARLAEITGAYVGGQYACAPNPLPARPRDAAHLLLPTAYLRPNYDRYLDVALAVPGPRRLVVIGMNPSKRGQSCDGVPFGDVHYARAIIGEQDQPGCWYPHLYDAQGCTLFACGGLPGGHGEVSGARLWSGLEQWVGGLPVLLSRVLVINYCPLLMLDQYGENVTPSALRPSPARDAIEAACDSHLRQVLSAVQARAVLALGEYAERRCKAALAGALAADATAKDPRPFPVHRADHPSPRRSGADWFRLTDPIVRAALADAGIPPREKL